MVRRAAVLGCLGTLIPVLALIVGLLFAGDVFARRYATGQLSDRISAAVPEASGVHARIRSFPFLGRLAVNGSVTEVGAHIDRLVAVRGVAFSDLDVDLQDVVVDNDAFFSSHQVRLKRIRRGIVTVSLTQQALTDAVGRPVTVTPYGVLVTALGGRTVRVNTIVSPFHNLVLEMSPLPTLVLPLPNAKLLPCALRLTDVQGQVDLRCTFTRIPDAFVQVASSVGG